MGRELYQWQEECLERWFGNHGRGMVQAVTGSGKTLLALTAARRLDKMLGQRLRVKIVVPTGALMRQWNRELREFLADARQDGEALKRSLGEAVPGSWLGETGSGEAQAGEAPDALQGKIGLRGSGYKASPDCKYMIYVINSARYELARQILAELRRGEAVLLIADECHRYESGQNQLIFDFLPYSKPYEAQFFSLGLSATLPSGQAQQYLASVLGRRIYSYGMDKALELHTVCPYDVYHISLFFQREEREEYEEISDRMSVLFRRLCQSLPTLGNMGQKELYERLRMLAGDKDRRLAEAASGYMMLSYKRKSLVCLASARVACACSLIETLMERMEISEKILIFGERISQADELYGLLQEQYPGKVGRYHSKMGQQARQNALERFRVGEHRILIACKAVDEGLDIPDASVGIILSGTSTQRQRAQRLGRVIRNTKEKSSASLYYLHIAESSEDSCFLPDIAGNRIYELEYDSDIREFYHPLYDETAEELLDRMRREGMDKGRLEEAGRCLRLGRIRSDWALARSEIEERIRGAKCVGDRNYWICMKRLGDGLAALARGRWPAGADEDAGAAVAGNLI